MLLILGMIGFVWVNRFLEDATKIVVFTLESLMPLLFGIVAAGLLADDPTLELLLSMPRPASKILFGRLLSVMGVGALLGFAMQILAHTWNIYVPYEGIEQMLIWLAPLIFFVGLSSAVGLTRGRMLDGVMICISLWVTFFVIARIIIGKCQEMPVGSVCLWMLTSPFVTPLQSVDSLWLANRLAWIALGAGLLWVSLQLAQNEDRLVQTAQ
jgi:ABC-type transport system involved in multi-copper enzyme maturation permease subunit